MRCESTAKYLKFIDDASFQNHALRRGWCSCVTYLFREVKDIETIYKSRKEEFP